MFSFIPLVYLRPGQKSKQLSPELHQQLMDITCLWIWLKPMLASTLEPNMLAKLNEMWDAGFLDKKLLGKIDFHLKSLIWVDGLNPTKHIKEILSYPQKNRQTSSRVPKKPVKLYRTSQTNPSNHFEEPQKTRQTLSNVPKKTRQTISRGPKKPVKPFRGAQKNPSDSSQ